MKAGRLVWGEASPRAFFFRGREGPPPGHFFRGGRESPPQGIFSEGGGPPPLFVLNAKMKSVPFACSSQRLQSTVSSAAEYSNN